jgi:hypothetical protein
MFEQARRSPVATRWHIENLCGADADGTLTWPTAEVLSVLLCLRCARSARALLPPEEQLQPHGRNIVSAAQRHMIPRSAAGPTSLKAIDTP